MIPPKSLAQLKHVSQSLFVKQFYEAVRILECSFSILNQPFLVFHLEEDFYIVCHHIFYFRFCLFKKDFYVFHKHMEDFYFSLLQKDLDTPFTSLFLMPFFALLIISSQHFYIQEKIISEMFRAFLFDQFFYALQKINLFILILSKF